MADVRFSIYAAASDAQPLVVALRRICHTPIHQRTEQVHGRDFSDASTGERVTGTLDRVAIDLICDDDQVAALCEAVRTARRRQPVRWAVSPIIAKGRFE
jgi:hypothetical protein